MQDQGQSKQFKTKEYCKRHHHTLYYIIILTFYYRTIVINTAWSWHRNRIRNPDTNPKNYSSLTFYRDAKNTHWKKKTSSANSIRRTGFQHGENERRSFLSPYTKLNSKWVSGFKIKPDTMKLVEKPKMYTSTYGYRSGLL